MSSTTTAHNVCTYILLPPPTYYKTISKYCCALVPADCLCVANEQQKGEGKTEQQYGDLEVIDFRFRLGMVAPGRSCLSLGIYP